MLVFILISLLIMPYLHTCLAQNIFAYMAVDLHRLVYLFYLVNDYESGKEDEGACMLYLLTNGFKSDSLFVPWKSPTCILGCSPKRDTFIIEAINFRYFLNTFLLSKNIMVLVRVIQKKDVVLELVLCSVLKPQLYRNVTFLKRSFFLVNAFRVAF